MPIRPEDLRILLYPAPSLRVRAQPVESITEEVRAVAGRMIELMDEMKGVGLAAPQVGVAWRIFVTRAPEEGEARVYVNPRITPVGDEREVYEEGCLSLPDIHVDIERPKAVALSARDLDGNELEVVSNGFPARIWQHELDHLNGILIIDKMSTLDRLATRKALKELERAAKAV